MLANYPASNSVGRCRCNVTDARTDGGEFAGLQLAYAGVPVLANSLICELMAVLVAAGGVRGKLHRRLDIDYYAVARRETPSPRGKNPPFIARARARAIVKVDS